MLGGNLAGKTRRCESLETHAQRAFSGRGFLPLGSSREEDKTQEDSEEGFVVTSGCSSCRIENAIFLLLHWFKRE